MTNKTKQDLQLVTTNFVIVLACPTKLITESPKTNTTGSMPSNKSNMAVDIAAIYILNTFENLL